MQNVSGVWTMEKETLTKIVCQFFSAHSFFICLLILVDSFANSSDFALWFYSNSCRSGGGPIISIKFIPFHAGSALLCGVSWFWDVQNMNSSWSAFQCTWAAWWGMVAEPSSLIRAFSPESGSGQFSSREQFLYTLWQRLCYLCFQHRKPLQNAPTAEQFSLLGIAVSRPVFSKKSEPDEFRGFSVQF